MAQYRTQLCEASLCLDASHGAVAQGGPATHNRQGERSGARLWTWPRTTAWPTSGRALELAVCRRRCVCVGINGLMCVGGGGGGCHIIEEGLHGSRGGRSAEGGLCQKDV